MIPHSATRRPLGRVVLRHARRLVLLIGIASIAGSAPTHAQDDTLLIDAVVRLMIQDGPAEVVPALSYNSTMLVPLLRFLELSDLLIGDVPVA